MARKKVSLAYIREEASRRATLKKRRKGIMKKASELSTLCGVDACTIVYGEEETQPEVWPSESKVKATLDRFRRMSDMDRSKKKMDQQGFLSQQIMKLKEQIRKQQRDNWELQMMMVLNHAIDGTCTLREARLDEAAVLARFIDERLQVVKAAADTLRQQNNLLHGHGHGHGETSSSCNPNPNPNPNLEQHDVKELGFQMMIGNYGGGLEEVMMGARGGTSTVATPSWMDAPFDHFPMHL